MNIKALALTGLSILSIEASAATMASTSPRAFCEDRKDRNYFQDLLKDEDNQLSFTNQVAFLTAAFAGGIRDLRETRFTWRFIAQT